MLGNWQQLITDKDADSPDANGTDNTECRDHNMANELFEQDLDCTSDLHDHTFDAAGNMRTQEVGNESTPTLITYTHDLWNRLIKVEYTPNGGSASTRAEYDYNGLNWRIAKRADTDASGGGGGAGLDQQSLMYYSAEWQVVEERYDDESSFPANGNDADVDRHMQYIWGTRYIDDLAIRRVDPDTDGDYDDVYYHCTDVMFSTVAVLDDAAVLLERVSYDPYGRARHHKLADCSGDGGVGSVDQLIVNNNWGSYPAPGDINRDGQVSVTDLLAVNNDWGSAIAHGELSTTGNVIGWDGYVFNVEVAGLYTVRRRHLDVQLGRWISRDPAGSIDGMGLYEYVRSNPMAYRDSLGLVIDVPSRILLAVQQGALTLEEAALILGIPAATLAAIIADNQAIEELVKRFTRQAKAYGSDPCALAMDAVDQAEKAIDSLLRQVDRHRRWINDPRCYPGDYIPDEHLERARDKWRKDVERQLREIDRHKEALKKLRKIMKEACKRWYKPWTWHRYIF